MAVSPKLRFTFDGKIERSWFFGRQALTLRAWATLPGQSEDGGTKGEFFATELYRLLYAAFCERIQPVLEPIMGTQIDLLPIVANLSKKPGGLETLRLKNARGSRDDRSARERLLEVEGTVERKVSDEEPELDVEAPKKEIESYQFSILSDFESFGAKGGINYKLRYQEKLPAGDAGAEGPKLPFSDYHAQKVRSFCFAADFFTASAFGTSFGLVPAVNSGFVWELRDGMISLWLTRELEKGQSISTVGSWREAQDFETALVRIGLSETFIQDAIEYLEAI